MSPRLVFRPKILCFTDYYLPSYKAGGAVRTIANMVSDLGDEFDFMIVTRDRDYLDVAPFENIIVDEWNKVGKASVFYASKKALGFCGVMRILRESPHDLIYLNSFYSYRFTIAPILNYWLGLVGKKPIILAPRGEFSTGALTLKPIKKKTYIFLAKLLGIYRRVIWQASSHLEADDIRRVIMHTKDNLKIVVASDSLYPIDRMVGKAYISDLFVRNSYPLRIIFLSRVSPKKNLDYLLRVLAGVDASIVLSIYGPLDNAYWKCCQDLIKNLPSHIQAIYYGEVIHEQVSKIFSEHDVFIFPTLGENFGHVIYEALAAGTSIIVSDRTPWVEDQYGAVEVIPLENPDIWVAAILRWTTFDAKKFKSRREAAVAYAVGYAGTNLAKEENRRLFFSALNGTQDKMAEAQP